MLIEGTSSSLLVPFFLFFFFFVCLNSRHNSEKITPSQALTGRKIRLRSVVQNKDENRAKGGYGG